MQTPKLIFALATLFLLTACGGSDSDSDNDSGSSSSSSSGSSGGSGTLTLLASDKPNVSPCPSNAILTDANELAALKNALKTGTLRHLDLPFSASDPDNLVKKCGLDGFWDPAAHTDEVEPSGAVTLSLLVGTHNAGICSAGFANPAGFNDDIGFPQTGTYHSEFKVVDSGMTWHGRIRYTASGTSAGKTFISEGISVPGDIDNTLVYEVNGVVTAHSDVFNAIVDTLTASTTDAPSATLAIRPGTGEAVIFTGLLELICVEKS